MTAMIYAFMTADVHRAAREYEDEGEYGWVDPRRSRTTLFESRNDVGPVVKEYEDSEELYDYVRDALNDLGAYESNGNGTFYGTDREQDFESGDLWSYCLHFTQKLYGPNGWAEKPWAPAPSKL